MYAIIASGGKQYKVTNGDVVKFEKLEGNAGDKVVFDQVLLISEKSITVGNPVIANAAVNGEIVEQGKDKKVIVYKYKPKSGYHKKNGHRQPITLVKIENVVLNGVELEADKPEVALEEPKAEEAAEVAEAVEEKVEEVVETIEEAAAEEAAETEEEVEVEVEIIDAAEAVEEAKEALADAAESTEE